MSRLLRARRVPNRTEGTRKIGSSGGIIRICGHELAIPRGAIPDRLEVSITFSEPESDYIKVTIEAEGHNSFHFREGHPAILTMSYKRKDEDLLPGEVLRVYQVRPEDDTIIGEPSLIGAADQAREEVKVRLDHLSGYVIGSGRVESPTEEP